VTHLTDRSYDLLLQGSLPPEEARALARHLEEACTVCEEFLASRPTADAADGLVEGALGALVPAGGRGHDLEFARIERALREGPPRPRASRRIGSAALAAAVLAAGLAGLLVPRAGPERPAWDGTKGAAQASLPVRLRFAVVTAAAGGPPALEKGVPGQVVAPEASLQFEIESGRAAHAALVRVPESGAPELFWSERVAEGRTAIAVEGRPAAYPLAELSGAQRFVLVAAEERLHPERIARAVEVVAGSGRLAAEAPALDGLSLDVVEVRVR
jgi:hypothetical protein